MTTPHQSRNGSDNRRDFLRESLALAALPVGLVGGLAESAIAQPKSNAALRLGVLGCGQRGLQIAKECLKSSVAQVELHGLADLFPDRIQQVYRSLNGSFAEQLRIEASQRYVGLQAVRQLAASDVQLVVVAAAPGFRAEHVQALTSAGKHVYVERPWATTVRESWLMADIAAEAEARGLIVQAGLQHRSQPAMRQAVELLQQGSIGRLVFARLVRTQPQGTPGCQPASVGKSQPLRHWQQNIQAGGHPFVQQLTGGLDLINWIVGRTPASATGLKVPHASGSSTNYAVQFEYADGPALGCSLLTTGSAHSLSVQVQGTRGWADLSRGKIFDQRNEILWSGGALSLSSQASIDHWLKAILDSTSPSALAEGTAGQFAAGVLSTQTALLGQAALLAGTRPVPWQEVVATASSCSDSRLNTPC